MIENKGHIRASSVIEGIWAEEVKRGELCDLLYAADQCQSMCGSVCLSIMSEEFWEYPLILMKAHVQTASISTDVMECYSSKQFPVP